MYKSTFVGKIRAFIVDEIPASISNIYESESESESDGNDDHAGKDNFRSFVNSFRRFPNRITIPMQSICSTNDIAE